MARTALFRRVAAISAAVLAVLGAAAVLGISVKVGWTLAHPEREHVALPAAVREIGLKGVSFAARGDRVMLQGWFLSAGTSNKTVIFAHGYGKNRLQDDVPGLDLARSLQANGFNVLLFDFRGCGESGGNFTSIGQYEKNDLLGAVDFVKKMGRPGEHVGFLGFSMGAVVSLLAAAEDPRVEAVVADSPFADLSSYLAANLPVWSDLPAFPFTPVILNVMPAVLHIDPDKVSPVKVIGNIKAPILLVHGRADDVIPPSNSAELYKAARGTKKLWLVPGAGHVGSYRQEPGEYLRNILNLYAQMK